MIFSYGEIIFIEAENSKSIYLNINEYFIMRKLENKENIDISNSIFRETDEKAFFPLSEIICQKKDFSKRRSKTQINNQFQVPKSKKEIHIEKSYELPYSCNLKETTSSLFEFLHNYDKKEALRVSRNKIETSLEMKQFGECEKSLYFENKNSRVYSKNSENSIEFLKSQFEFIKQENLKLSQDLKLKFASYLK